MSSSISRSSQVNKLQRHKSTKQHVNTANSRAPLGIVLNHEPTSNNGACSPSAFDADGVITGKQEILDNRRLRFNRQSTVVRLLPKSATRNCLRLPISDSVKIVKSKKHDSCHFVGLATCGNVWTCPVCAAKISERRRIELKAAITQHEARGGSVLLITFTHSHQREESLKSLLERQSLASQWFYRHRTYKELKQRYMKLGRVRALEVNHGQANGWHPHMHELWFLDLNLHDYSILKAEIFSLWLKACKRFGLGLPSEKHGIDVRGGEQASAYVTKFGNQDHWGLESELSKSHLKKGRNGSRSPFQFLDDYCLGDKQSGALFIEYAEAFRGKRQLTWSRGLKDLFNLEELTDEELIESEEDDGELVVRVSKADWYSLLFTRHAMLDPRLLLLQLAENGGADAVTTYLNGIPKKPLKSLH